MAWSRSNRRPCKKSNVKSGSCSITLKCLQQLSLSALCSFTKPCTAQSSKCISPLSGWQSPRGSDVQMRAGWSERERDTELPHRMSLLQFKWDLKKKKKKTGFGSYICFSLLLCFGAAFFFSPRSWNLLHLIFNLLSVCHIFIIHQIILHITSRGLIKGVRIFFIAQSLTRFDWCGKQLQQCSDRLLFFTWSIVSIKLLYLHLNDAVWSWLTLRRKRVSKILNIWTENSVSLSNSCKTFICKLLSVKIDPLLNPAGPKKGSASWLWSSGVQGNAVVECVGDWDPWSCLSAVAPTVRSILLLGNIWITIRTCISLGKEETACALVTSVSSSVSQIFVILERNFSSWK